MIIRRLLPALVLLAVLVTAGCGASAHAAGTARHAVDGTVTAESGTTWTVRTTDGRDLTVQLTPTTRFGRTHQPSSADRFPTGSRVRVLGTVAGTTITARRVLPPLSTRAGQTPTPTPTPTSTPSRAPATPTTTPTAPSPAAADGTATEAVQAAVAAAPSGVAVGVAALDTADGDVVGGTTGATGFESASVVKLVTVVDLLHRSETGDITLSGDDMTAIGRALSLSDDDAMDTLWEEYGGTQTVTDVVSLVGLHDTTPSTDPDEWGETVISARDVLAVYRYAFTSLSPADQQVVRSGLLGAADAGADGFDQAFGLLDPPRPAGAMAKQGWMSDGDLYLHTTGVPAAGSPWVVAVLTRQPGGDSWDTARAAVDTVTRALTTRLAAPAA
ncbi:hypothetical protein [Actinomycetospora sp. CA-084318]|uniref:hypothetical protein n=1 Tax=Actinomycetospora sp. CA-084318 TaxID=3239892 RepID=UPI003D98594C